MSDEKKALLASGDEALLKAAQNGGADCIVVTPDILSELQTAIQTRTADIEARYDGLVNECPYETRLAVAAWVMKAIVSHAQEGGTFRYLIYHRLGFESNAYVPLYLAGGMTISNEFSLAEPQPKEEEETA